jgi:hypothetical protein
VTLAHLLSGRDRDTRRTTRLAAAACAVATLVLLTGLSAVHAATERERPPTWQTPVLLDPGVAADAPAAGEIALSTTTVRDRTVTVAHVAPTSTGAGPDGIEALPAPGQVLASPALIALARALPAAEVADRWGGAVDTWSPLPGSALVTPDDLAVIVGVPSGDSTLVPAAVVDANDPSAESVAGRYTGFAQTDPDREALIPGLVASGVALLLVPTFTLLSAAARLGASRRSARTARLRLAGATPRQAQTVTALDAVATGALGAVGGVVAHLALLPALAQVHLQGLRPFLGDLTVAPLVAAAVVLGVVAVATGSAVTGVRGAVRDAWGTAQAARPASTRLRRVVLVLAGAAVLAVIARTVSLSTSGQLTVMIVAYGLLGVLGASVVDLVGRVMARRARRADTLLAGRRLADDPRGAWRQIGGLVLAGFVAGFFGGASIGTLSADDGGDAVVLPVPGVQAETVAAAGRTALAGTDLDLAVEPADGYYLAPVEDLAALVVRGAGDPAAVDRALTALDGLVPGQPALAPGAVQAELRTAGQALRETALGTLVVSALLAAASTGLAAAASVLDRRGVYRSLRLTGVPLRVIDRARSVETVVPLVTLLTLTTGAGLLAASRLNATLGTTADTGAQVVVVVFTLLALAGAALSVRASSGLLARASSPAAGD